MEQELFEKFNKLDLNDKRNEYNQEVIKLFSLLYELANGTKPLNNVNIKNYDSTQDKNISEEDFLNQEYQNVINIIKALIHYISWK